MNWRKEYNALILETGKAVKFDFPIKRIHEMDDVLNIVLDISDECMAKENYYDISKKDESVRWKDRIVHDVSFNYPVNEYQQKSRQCAMDWAKEENVLVLNNNVRIVFDYSIEAVLETFGTIIVLLDSPPQITMTENVFGVSYEGKIIWQIERIPATTSPHNRYTNISESGVPGIFVAFNSNCTNVYTDVLTGKVLDTEFTK